MRSTQYKLLAIPDVRHWHRKQCHTNDNVEEDLAQLKANLKSCFDYYSITVPFNSERQVWTIQTGKTETDSFRAVALAIKSTFRVTNPDQYFVCVFKTAHDRHAALVSLKHDTCHFWRSGTFLIFELVRSVND